ncbi:hypothetical protein ZTR_10068 [Talaromyces verruculosus]|nr:hypothetical protein ZTR_10068 [Talaromyces verruculosus]
MENSSGTYSTAAKKGERNSTENEAGPINESNASNEQSALQAAVEQGNKDILEYLVQAGADINAPAAEIGGRTPLQAAAEQGRRGIVEYLIQVGADVNTPAAELGGRTVLQKAAEQGQEDIVELLVKKKADVNCQADNNEGRTALQAAAEKGAENIVKFLVEAKANVNAPAAEVGGRTALQAAAEQGHKAVAECLVKARANVNAPPAEAEGRTALQAAAEQGNENMIDYLIQAGADINSPAGKIEGRTALQAAAEQGNKDIVEYLIRIGADINGPAAKVRGRTALQAAAEQGHKAVAECLVKARANVNAPPAEAEGRTALQAAAEQGNENMIDYLIQAGADINSLAGKIEGRTALQAAAEQGNKDIVEYLIRIGADINGPAAKVRGRTALQAAAEQGHKGIVEYLVETGANINAPAVMEGARSALQAAAEQGYEDIVEYLVRGGADINASASEVGGRTALQAAAEQGKKYIVEYLVQAEADINAPAAEVGGQTTLQAAAEQGEKDIVEYLVQIGADVNAPPAKFRGRTALQAAAEPGHRGIVEYLVQAGADINAPPAEFGGRTALQAAAGQGHKDIVVYLVQVIADVNDLLAKHGGRTALQAEAELAKKDVVEWLIGRDAETHSRIAAHINAPPAEVEGRTALQAAAEQGHQDIVEYLIQVGADINAQPAAEYGVTAVQAAAENHFIRILRLLLDRGAQIDLMKADFFADRALIEAAKENRQPKEIRRRLIVCCDGTWNRNDTDRPLSNAARISRCIENLDTRDDGKVFTQVLYYQSGIGSSSSWPGRLWDGAFASVWDTVASVGFNPRILSRLYTRKLDISNQPSTYVENAFQALALDERRYHFRPEVWTEQGNGRGTLGQCWFRGAHTDVGGGNELCGLANLSLAWILSQLRPFVLFDWKKLKDLAMDHEVVLRELPEYEPSSVARRGFKVHNSMTWFYWLLGLGSAIRKPKPSSPETMHSSVRVFQRYENSNQEVQDANCGPGECEMPNCHSLENFRIVWNDGLPQWVTTRDNTTRDNHVKEDRPNKTEYQIWQQWWNMEPDFADARRLLENLGLKIAAFISGPWFLNHHYIKTSPCTLDHMAKKQVKAVERMMNRMTMIMNERRRSPRKRTQHPVREYCTQACLLGIVRKLPLDVNCPNFPNHKPNSPHGEHPIAKEDICLLLRKQLDRSLDQDCECLDRQGLFGDVGVLFKVTLTKYGYTFVAKGVQKANERDLAHEMKVYSRLAPLQGRDIPVCLGSISLTRPYPLVSMAKVTTMLLMSWAGTSLRYNTWPEDVDIKKETDKTLQTLAQSGVHHGDIRESNLVSSTILQRHIDEIMDYKSADHLEETAVVSHINQVTDVQAWIEITQDAKEATAAEHSTTFWQGINVYRKAAFWSFIVSMTIIMEGYDTALLGNLYALLVASVISSGPFASQLCGVSVIRRHS